MTALHMAVFMGNAAAVEILLQSGACPLHRNRRLRRSRRVDAMALMPWANSPRVLAMLTKAVADKSSGDLCTQDLPAEAVANKVCTDQHNDSPCTEGTKSESECMPASDLI